MQGKKVGKVLKEDAIRWKVVPKGNKSFMRSETRHHISVLDKKVVQLYQFFYLPIFSKWIKKFYHQLKAQRKEVLELKV